MTPQAEYALLSSINAWERKLMLAKAGKADEICMGWNACPLCCQFLSSRDRCDGCPVSERTKRNNCEGTPHIGAVNAKRALLNNQSPDIHDALLGELVAAIQLEIDFLQSLLPEQGDAQQ